MYTHSAKIKTLSAFFNDQGLGIVEALVLVQEPRVAVHIIGP